MSSLRFASLVLLAAACGGSVSSNANDGGTSDSTLPPRVPKLHRAAGAACPQGRGPGYSNDAGGSPFECSHDSDCTTGKNGRCLLRMGGPFGTTCSYDQCFADSDCASGLPCECRASVDDSTANSCVTDSQCRVDSDCGPGGFCSPGAIAGENCGLVFHCHTRSDTCLDDTDCGMSNLCVFDTSVAVPHWACSHPCIPPP